MKKQLPLIVLSNIFVIISCSPQYVTNRQNVPLLTKQGEIKSSASMGIGGFDFQMALAVTNNFAVMSNGQWTKFENRYLMSDEVNTLTQKSIEAALGYYKTIGTNGVFEVYGGYGIGASDLKKRSIEKYSKGDFGKIFVQPNVGFHSNYFSAGFGLRALYVHFDRIKETKKDIDQISGNTTHSTLINIKSYFVEPTFTMKAGLKKLKAIGQIGTSFLLNSKKFDHQPFMLSLGIELNFEK